MEKNETAPAICPARDQGVEDSSEKNIKVSIAKKLDLFYLTGIAIRTQDNICTQGLSQCLRDLLF